MKIFILGIVLSLTILLSQNAVALDIQYVFDAQNSDNPASDPNATKLSAALEYVASVFEDIIEDDHTLVLTYRWDDNLTESTGFSGVHNFGTEDENGREDTGGVRFESERLYYFDSTPWDDSEYDMGQELFRDYSQATQNDRFAGNVPEVFEAAYNGKPISTAPDDAKNGMDFITLAFQEVGHALGMSAALSSLQAETADDDYDVNPTFVRGNSMDLLVRSHDIGVTETHLFGNDAVMASLSSKERTRPSAADILAMAAASNWTQIDLRRQDFLGGSNWNTQGNWLGNDTPDTADDAFIRLQNTTVNVSLSAFAAAGDLVISDGNTLATDDNTMFVQETASVMDANTKIRVQANGKLRAETLIITGGGQVVMTGGLIESDDIYIGTGGTTMITGYGTIDANTSGIAEAINDGTIKADGGTLILTSSNSIAYDLDGLTENGYVEVIDGDLRLETSMTDPFDGLMVVGTDRTATFDVAWRVGKFGRLVLAGSAANPALVTTATLFNIDGELLVDGVGTLSQGFLTFSNTAEVDIPNPLNKLRLDSLTTFNGGTYIGNGEMEQNGDATINNGTIIDVSTYDWDGAAGNTTTTINPGVIFTINSSKIDDGDPAADGFDGTVNINGGKLVVNTPDPWRHEGTMNLTQVGQTGKVDGSEMIVFGSINTAGTNTIYSDVSFRSSAQVQAPNAMDSLFLNGHTTFRGGSYTGLGAILQEGDAIVTTSTTIDVATYNMDGSGGSTVIDIIPSVTFTINSQKIDNNPATDGFDGTVNIDGGTLAVNTSTAWRLDGVMNLEQDFASAKVQGSVMLVFGQINSTKTNIIEADVEFFDSAVVTVPNSGGIFPDVLQLSGQTDYYGGSYTGNGTLRQVGNALIVEDTTIDVGTFDFDGFETTTISINPFTRLTINAGRIESAQPDVDGFDGTVNVAGGTIEVNTDEPWRMDGQMNLQTNFSSAVVDGSQQMVVHGTIQSTGIINGIFADVKFENTAVVSIPNNGDMLQLLGETTYCGGSYTGLGTLAQIGNASVLKNTTIDVAVYDWDGGVTPSNTLVFASTFTINSDKITNGDPTTSGYAGVATLDRSTLEVWTQQDWLLDGGTIDMDLSTVSGVGLINDGLVIGNGSVQPRSFINNGTTSARGGTLVLESGDFPDLDGQYGSGVLNANDGDMHVPGFLGSMFTFSGRLNVDLDYEYRMDYMGLLNRGTVTLTGGTYVAPQFDHLGTLLVRTNTSTLDSISQFFNDSTSILLADLRIVGQATFNSGASVTGSGSLIITDGAMVNGEGNVDVDVINEGELDPGDSPGIFMINGNYTQSQTGVLNLEIVPEDIASDHHQGEPLILDFDQVIITGQATFGGTLNLMLEDDMHIDVGMAIEVLTYSSRQGVFDQITGMNLDTDSAMAAIYSSGRLALVAAILGDANLDQTVGLLDLDIMGQNFGITTQRTWSHGDFDGDGAVGLLDLDIMGSHFGQQTRTPEPGSIVLLATGVVAIIRRRCAV